MAAQMGASAAAARAHEELYAYWAGLRRSGRLPGRDDIHPDDFKRLLPTISLIDVRRDPLEFLLDVMQGKIIPTAEQLKAAQTAAQYMHAKKGESGGKKEEAAEKQKAAASGRFGMREPPRLAAAGGKAL